MRKDGGGPPSKLELLVNRIQGTLEKLPTCLKRNIVTQYVLTNQNLMLTLTTQTNNIISYNRMNYSIEEFFIHS